MWPFSARIQPFSEMTTVIGSFSIIACWIASRSASGALENNVRRRPISVALANFFFTSPISQATVCHCLFVGREQCLDFRLLLRKTFEFGADFELFQLAQRAQPHVEDRFGLQVGERETLHQGRLGLILLADDADHLGRD